MHRSIAPRLALVAASLLLGSCETLKSLDFHSQPPAPPAPCPRAVVADQAGHLTRFVGADKDPAHVQFEAQIGDLTGDCGYDDSSIDVDMKVQILGSRGAANTTGQATFNYFVAIARPDKTILAREAFDATIEFPGNQTQNGVVDEIQQTIPLQSGQTGTDFVIIVGFEMTPDELEYNRKQGR
jgi:hypothetical protein